MKKSQIAILFLCFMISSFAYGQKAKFRNDICVVQKVRLPINYTEPQERTYHVTTKGAYADNIDPTEKKIYGWTLTEDSPQVKAVVNVYNVSTKSPQKQSEKKEKKDKAGKVTKWTEYHYTNSSTGKGTMLVYGLSNPFKFEVKKSEKEKSKYQKKQEAKAEEKKKDLEDNPFLTADVIEEAAENDITDDGGMETSDLPFVDRISLDKTKRVKTGNFRKSSLAYKEYQNKQHEELQVFGNSYPERAYNTAMHNLNVLYGFTPVNSRFYLKRMKSKKHPELKMWNDACQAAETMFKTFSYNESIDDKQKKFDPIIKYFASQVDKIKKDDKKQRKMRKAALSNLLNILYYLDRHESVVDIASKHVETKKIGKMSKRMKEKAQKQFAHLAFHKMTSCHIESTEEINADEIESEELVEEEVD